MIIPITRRRLNETIEGYSVSLEEPFMRELTDGWAAFYWRVQNGGEYGKPPKRRLQPLSLIRCMR